MAIVGILAIRWLASGSGVPWGAQQPALVIVISAATLLVALAYSQACAVRRALHNLPDLVRATAWGERGGDFPDVGGGQEIAVLRNGLGDLANDMAREIEARAKMERMALTDSLTGLPNRRGLFEFFAKIADTEPVGPPQPIGVMHVDLDHFKAINDLHGHDAGDFVLREATRRMATTIRDTDLLARLGGDEFVVVAPQVENEWVLERIAERIIGLFQEPMFYHGTPLRLGTSIGIVLGGQRGKMLDPARLLINADIALCAAKERGRQQYTLFTSSMAKAVQTRQGQADEIRAGIDAGAFQPVFQPIVDRGTGRISGIEVAPCWHHPEHGVLGAETFLDTAEAYKLIEDLADRVIEATFSHCQSWRLGGLEPPVLHIVTTRTQLMSPMLTDKVSWALDEANLPTDQIAIQVAEPQCSGRGVELALGNIARLRELGLGIVLSEFGAGGGALNTLAAVKAHSVKLARAVTTNLNDQRNGPAALSLVQATLGVGAGLGVAVAATGIDSEAEEAALATLGVTHLQGTAVAAPMHAADMAVWLAENQARPAA